MSEQNMTYKELQEKIAQLEKALIENEKQFEEGLIEEKISATKIKENERLLEEVGAIAHIGGWEMDMITRTGKWTKGTYDIVEIPYGDPVPGPDEHVDYYLPQYQDMIKTKMIDLIENGCELEFEAEAITAKGNIKWFKAHGRRVMQDGKCIKIYGTLQDITERKQAEETLKKNKNILEKIADNYPNSYVSIIEMDLTCGYTSGQEFIKQGLDPKTFIGLSLKDVFGEYEPVIKERYLNTFAGEEQNFELFLNNQHQLYKTVPLQNEKGEIDKILAVVENVTKRKLSEEALRSSQTFNETLLNTSPDIIYIYYIIEYKNVYSNVGITKVLGYTLEEVQGMGETLLSILMHPDDFDIYLKETYPRYQNLADGEMITHEYRMKHKDGSWHWLYCRESVFLRDTEGSAKHIFGLVSDVTESKLAEAGLLEAKETAERYLDMAGSMILSLNPQGEISMINQAGLDILEYSRAELIGKNWFDTCIPKDINEQIKMFFARIIMGEIESLDHYENNVVTKSGKLKMISWYSTILRDENNEVVTILSSGQDVTDIRKAQVKLQESQNRYKNFITNSSEGIYRIEMKEPVPIGLPEEELVKTLNENSIVAEINIALAEMYGLKIEDMIGKPVVDFAPNYGERASLVIQNEDHHVRDKLATDIDKTGNSVYLSETYHGEIEDGKLIRIWGVQRNITERKLIEDKLKDSENRYFNLFENSVEFLFTIDLVGNFTDVNKAAEVLTGYSKSELLKMNFKDYTSKKDHRRLFFTLSNVYKTGKPVQNFPVEAEMKNKSKKYFETSFTLLKKGEQVIGFQGTSKDVTERNQIQENLVKAKERAEESDRLKSAFLANMSHEIRTPMNGILGFADLLKEPGLTSNQQKKYIGIIEKSGERMLNTINDLIDISKIEAGQVEITHSATNINEHIDYFYTFFKPEARQKNIAFSLSKALSDQEAIIQTDREKLYAILTNLIKNAIKYTHEGSIEFGYFVVQTHGHASQQNTGRASLQS
nr:PAS domain S-box protein [Bacteroidota bacterium]